MKSVCGGCGVSALWIVCAVGGVCPCEVSAICSVW